MTLRIAWQLRDAEGGVVAAGFETVDERFAAVDPYDTTLIAADKIERALLQHMEATRAADAERRARNLLRRHEKRDATVELR